MAGDGDEMTDIPDDVKATAEKLAHFWCHEDYLPDGEGQMAGDIADAIMAPRNLGHPADVWEMAKDIAPLVPSYAEVAAQAIAAERERCAKLVESFVAQRDVQLEVEYWVNDTKGGDATVDEFVPYIGQRLAAAIRGVK